MLKHFVVICAVFGWYLHALSTALEDDSDSLRSMCARNGEGCEEEDGKTDEYSEYDGNEDVDDDGPEIISTLDTDDNKELDWEGQNDDEMTTIWNDEKDARRSRDREEPFFNRLMSGGDEQCFNNPVGVADPSIIPDNQMAASNYYSNLYLPSYGRLNGTRGKGCWCARDSGKLSDWLQVDLGKTFPVCGVATQGKWNGDEWATDFKLLYSQNRKVWTTFKDVKGADVVFHRVGGSDIIDYHMLWKPVSARFIRFNPVDQYNWNCLRVEVYGAKAIACPALNVSPLVKTSPENCMTSQMPLNTTCSFSCPQGYELQGPPYKKCELAGQWADNDTTVSCIDIDECAESRNGGCSHECVNTAGGYKCECTDPELSLSADNKTCHAPGVNVHCNSKNMTIIIPKSLLRGIDREHLRLLDTNCTATETSAHVYLTTPLTGCNTTSRVSPTTIVYSNTVMEIPVAAEDVITLVREIEIKFSCFYSKYGEVSSVGWKPSKRKLVFNNEGKGNLSLVLKMFPNDSFVRPYTKGDFPVDVVLRKRLFFEASVASDDKQLSIRADRCYATPTQDRMNPLKYEFIMKGCPNDATVQYHSATSVGAQRFSLEAFKFIADHPFVFLHCHVIICNATDPVSPCVKRCKLGGRRRRTASSHVTNDEYNLSEGPIHLTRDKREELESSGITKSVFSPTVILALPLVCIVCLMGVALMAMKSHDKPVGYAVVATEVQK